MCSTCGCKGAENFSLEEGGVTEKYWIYRSLRGSGLGMSREKGIIFDNLADAEAYVEEKEAMFPNAEYSIITKRYGAESFEAPMTRYDEYCISCGSDSGANSNLCMKCQKMFGVKKASNRMIARLGLGAESFEAQRKLTDIDRDGKPYTGQIYPDHPDLDPVKADRNKDGYMSSWERALGNQVARGMEKYKSERKPSMKRMSMRKTSRKSTSILPSVIVVGVIAAIVGSKIRK